jgi:hypothetical protein
MRCIICSAEASRLTLAAGPHLLLAICSQCGQVVDPYVEYDLAIVLLDLLLLNPRVFRHLIWNWRGRRDLNTASPTRLVLQMIAAVWLSETYLLWSCLVLPRLAHWATHAAMSAAISVWPDAAGRSLYTGGIAALGKQPERGVSPMAGLRAYSSSSISSSTFIRSSSLFLLCLLLAAATLCAGTLLLMVVTVPRRTHTPQSGSSSTDPGVRDSPHPRWSAAYILVSSLAPILVALMVVLSQPLPYYVLLKEGLQLLAQATALHALDNKASTPCCLFRALCRSVPCLLLYVLVWEWW